MTPHDNISFSAVTSADFDELAALRIAAMQASLERVGRFDPERARERLRKSFYPEHTKFVVLDGERVGFYTFRPTDDGYHLDHLYVHPSHQCRGVGSQVLRHLLSLSDARQMPVHLGALRDSPSNRFYQRHGFAQTAEDEWDIYYTRTAPSRMPFAAPKLIEASRVCVRPLLESDLPSLLDINSDAEVVKYLGHEPWQAISEAEAWFVRISKLQAAGSALEFVIVEKQTGKVIGRCGLFDHDPVDAQASLGYILGRSYWRQGFMREALASLIGCAFGEMGLRRLEAKVEAPNTASSALLRRLGFSKEGVLRERWTTQGETTDAEVFGLLRHERSNPFTSRTAELADSKGSISSSIAVAIFIFPEVEVLDFAGPFEVFTTASRVLKMMDASVTPPFTVCTIAQHEGSLRARAGLTVIPDHTFANHPAIDLLIIPGGVVSTPLKTPAIAEWIKRTSATTKLTASVCNGALLLAQAGLLDGKRCTTHWSDVDDLKKMCPSLTVLEQTRWVDEGSIVTSGGISAGIDMCLHLVERLANRELAVATARRMEFNWCEDAAP